MAGAGLSCSAGIPDFRTPGTGLYDNLETYNLPYAEAIFDLDYFRANPEPFYLLCRSLWPGSFAPTPAHHFLRLLHDKGLLRRVYTVRQLSFVFAPLSLSWSAKNPTNTNV
jgi:NAD-dependent deacetylase sirtuin 2